MKKVILNLGGGTLIEGCKNVIGEFLGESLSQPQNQTQSQPLGPSSTAQSQAYPIRFTGELPAAPQLAATQTRWQHLYAARNQDQALRIHLLDVEGLRYSENDFNQCCLQLVNQFEAWLNTPELLQIDRALRTEFKRSDDVQIILETADLQLCKLPWHLWPLFEDYPQAELTFGALDWRPLPNRPFNHRKNQGPSASSRILATLGNHDGLDLAADLTTLNHLQNTHLNVLDTPTLNQLHEHLWEPEGWDIFFFAGHSQTEGETGIINLNQHERLSIEQIKYALSQAIANGLKIAIFNSCDGLGLARQLSSLQIPYVVVMREPVPDAIAQQFLRYLLAAFTQGLPFHLAMREARQRLAGLENEAPCASWLPVIWQNPTAPAIYWQTLQPQADGGVKTAKRWGRSHAKQFAFKTLIASGIVLGIRALGLLEPVELIAYDQLMRQRPTESVDQRTVVVEVTEKTTSQYGYPLPDEQLTALIDRINDAQPLAIGLDLHRARPNPSRAESSLITDVEPSYDKFLRQVESTPSLFLVCFYDSKDKNYGTPAQLSEEVRAYQVGFSDLPIDRFTQFGGNPRSDVTAAGSNARMGEMVRRQWLSYDPNLSPASPNCETPYSLSFQLAFEYLDQAGVEPLTVTDDERWQFGPVVFDWLPQRVGAYQQLAAHSSQVLLNYRANQPGEEITVEQLMSDGFDPQMLTDKIVLIGYTAPVSKDYFETPYGPMAGLWVHAHMVSQLLSAVLDDRPMIHGLAQWQSWQWGDWVWIAMWGCAGGYVGIAIKRRSYWLLSLLLGGGALYLWCWIALISGLWLPLVPSALAATGSTVWLRANRPSDKKLAD